MELSFTSAVGPLVTDAMSGYHVPGIVVVAQSGTWPLETYADGVDGNGRRLTNETLFPVASVTKLVTALAILRLVDCGQIRLDDQLSAYLPDAVASVPGVTIRRLLCHTAGLPYDVDLTWTKSIARATWAGFAAECARTSPVYPPGIRVQYSNAGYGLLGVLVEQVTSESFQSFARNGILSILDIEGFLGDDLPRTPAKVIDVRGEYSGTEFEPFNSAHWRSLGLPWGGLLTSVVGALKIVRAFHTERAPFLQLTTATEAISNQTGRLPGGFLPPLVWRQCWWGLGPDLRGSKDPHWVPSSASPTTYGHAGASGALAYADPVSDIGWAIAGSRTADNGWLLRWGPKIGAAIVRYYQG